MLTKKDVEHVARLANLKLTNKELLTYTKQLQEVLGYMKNLEKVDTSNVKPTYQTIDGTINILREDKVTGGLSQKEALSAARHIHDGYFVAEHVFGNKDLKLKTKISDKRKQIDNLNAILTKVEASGKVAHKDLFVTKGVETTAGSRVLEGFIPQYSGSVVKILESAGFKTKYKLNQDAWGHGSSGENSDFGPTKNPWDVIRVAGGSSSGSAVVVAEGKVELATGTDTCGSIRLPSSFNNVSGIKPTYGAVSRYGVIAFASSLDCPGLIAKSVKELRKGFKHIAVKDPKDATSQSTKRNTIKNKKVKTIGLPKEFFAKGVDKEIKNLVLGAAKELEQRGYSLKEISLPHSRFAIAAYYIIAPTETSSNLARYDGIRYGNGREYFGPEAKRRIMLGSFASSAGYVDKYYEKAARVRTLIIKDLEKAYKNVDVILGPVSPTPAFLIGEKVDDPLQMYLEDIFAAPASLSGLPALALPCGFTKTNLPVGMQLIGPRWSEEMLFNLGERYQSFTDWHKKKPAKYED